MRFGLFVPQGWRLDLAGIDPADQWETMLGVAQIAEEGPFESIWLYDHFHTVPVPTDEATHEAWALMAAFAAATNRVRLGQMCTCMAYRNPAYLAKFAATTDIVSGGRVEMGIGAGWYEHEWRAYGYGFPPARERLGRLDEGVRIMRQLWTTGKATVDGEYYRVDGAICRPLPLQDGGIPLWIAERRGEADAADRGAVRELHELRRWRRGLRAQVGGAGRALQGRRHGLRRDRTLGQLQRGDRRNREGRPGPAGVAARALRPARRRRTGWRRRTRTSRRARWSAPRNRSPSD